MSVTTWTRIEPDIQTGDPQKDLSEGLAARLADPLWLLGRQWQMGEMQGENAGSPVGAQISATSYPIDTLTIGPKSSPWSNTSTAVDALVEHDGSPADLSLRAAGGRSFLDVLAENKLGGYQPAAKSAYAFTPSAAGNVLDSVLIAGSIDGDRLLADAAAGKIATVLKVASADSDGFQKAVASWRRWYAARAATANNPAWQPDRLEYRFSMGADVKEGRVVLTAPEYDGSRIDWDVFEAGTFGTATGPAQPKSTRVNATPALLSVPGMPSPWFWELEDAGTDPGRIEAGPSDTARLLLIEATLAYAPDWFLMPLRLPAGTLSSIDNLLVTDTFGVTTIIRPTEIVRPHADWALWRVAQASTQQGSSRLGYLLLPPAVTSFLISEPIEEIAFVRDEAADLAWALHTVPGSHTYIPPPRTGAGDLIYVPMTLLPDDRIPLVLTESSDGRLLVRGGVLNEEVQPPTPLIGSAFRVHDEEVPDEGLMLRRHFKIGRTADGTLHLWVSRQTVPGARMPSSGLDFDLMLAGAASQT